MKKNGRKWRKIQAEKATIKSNVKLGEAFSKARNIVHLCYHYGGNPSGDCIRRLCYSKLKTVSEKECMCSECHQIFDIEKNNQMQKLLSYLSLPSSIKNRESIIELYQGIEPVYYRNVDFGVTEILGVETNSNNWKCCIGISQKNQYG